MNPSQTLALDREIITTLFAKLQSLEVRTVPNLQEITITLSPPESSLATHRPVHTLQVIFLPNPSPDTACKLHKSCHPLSLSLSLSFSKKQQSSRKPSPSTPTCSRKGLCHSFSFYFFIIKVEEKKRKTKDCLYPIIFCFYHHAQTWTQTLRVHPASLAQRQSSASPRCPHPRDFQGCQ